MGYNDSYDGQVNIDKENIPKAIRAITDKDPQGPDFESELSSLFREVGRLEKAPNFTGWLTAGDSTPVVCFATYGWTRGFSELEELLKNIAPHVRNAWIECKGEDKYLWAYSIEDGEFKELAGRVVYD